MNPLETCLQASALLRECGMKDPSGRNMPGDGPPAAQTSRGLPFTGGTLEQERREVLEAIMMDMRGRSDSAAWEANKRLLEHLATPLSRSHKSWTPAPIH